MLAEEQPARQQDELFAAEPEVADGEEFFLQRDDPPDGEQKHHPHPACGQQAHESRAILLVGRQFRGENRDEDHVVDAEHHLKGEEGGERGSRGGVREPRHCA